MTYFNPGSCLVGPLARTVGATEFSLLRDVDEDLCAGAVCFFPQMLTQPPEVLATDNCEGPLVPWGGSSLLQFLTISHVPLKPLCSAPQYSPDKQILSFCFMSSQRNSGSPLPRRKFYPQLCLLGQSLE